MMESHLVDSSGGHYKHGGPETRQAWSLTTIVQLRPQEAEDSGTVGVRARAWASEEGFQAERSPGAGFAHDSYDCTLKAARG